MLGQIARTAIRKTSRFGIRRYHGPSSDFKPQTMDEVPVPQGSWKKDYDSKQKTYNIQLAVGLAMLISTVSYIVVSDNFFFNAFPPTPKEEK